MLLCLSLFIFHLVIVFLLMLLLLLRSMQCSLFHTHAIPIRFASLCSIIVLTESDCWLCITFENNNNYFFFFFSSFVCHMFCHLVGLLCVLLYAQSFLKHTPVWCCCWSLFFAYHSIKVHRFPSKCFPSKCRILAENLLKERKTKHSIHSQFSHIHMLNVVWPEHINWVLQSAFDSNQSCD